MRNNNFTYLIDNRRSALGLLLLFFWALYRFYSAGYNAFMTICISPAVILYIYIAFRYRMFTFWLLFFMNYFIMWFLKNEWLPSGIPVSLYNEGLEILLLGIAIIDARQSSHFERTGNLMLLALMIWSGFCTLEIFNDTCGLGINAGAWYTGARGMAFQFLYAFFVFSIYISTPKTLITYIRIWTCLAFFSAFWAWKQQYIGFTTREYGWLWGVGYVTHILNGGTLIRYFSTFNDAAAYGCNAAATAVFLIIVAITFKIKKERLIFAIVAVAVIWGMFSSGTRTAIFCLGAGLALFVVLSKSIRIAVPFGILFFLAAVFLIFTDIGNGNQQIRRMRSAFNKKDASANVRDINQAAMQKYIRDAPWGIGIGMGYDNVPKNNKFYKLATMPPDSEYVYIWQRTGPIGITVFVITTIIMFCGACWVVMFRLKNRSLMGIGAGFCGAFLAIHLGGYGNQILSAFPNGLLFYGGLSIVYVLPYIEPEWIKYEENRLTIQEEKKRLKIEKKLASRV